MYKKYIFVFALSVFFFSGCGTSVSIDPDYSEDVDLSQYSSAIFAGGCFWCVEAAFEKYEGVVDAVSGYAAPEDYGQPTYEDVSRGGTQYYEAVAVYYDPSIIRYSDLLAIFWRQIDPTDPSGSFVDRGPQYRSAIFFANDHEKMLAESSKEVLEESGMYDSPLVTEILAQDAFYEAEEYHQDYYKKNMTQYSLYRARSGRDQYREQVWGSDKDYVLPKRLSKEELRDVLTPLQYHVTQEGGTERPFDNPYWDHKEEGIYVDIVSGEPLFSSRDKFDSGTGWPSFTKPIREGGIVRDLDTTLGIPRTEVRSLEGASHLGHVFDDGPDPTGLRYCINSAALRFIPVDQLAEEGLADFLGDFE